MKRSRPQRPLMGVKVLDQKNDPLDGHVGVSVFSLWRKRPTGLTLSPGKGGVMGDATTLIPICNCPPREYISIAVKVVLLKCVLCSFPQRIGRVCYIYAHTNALAQLPPSRCFSSFPTPFPPPSPIHEVRSLRLIFHVDQEESPVARCTEGMSSPPRLFQVE